MGFQVSPGVQVREFDLTTTVPAIATTVGAMAGVFRWGPVEDRELLATEDELAYRYLPPNDTNFETWFTAANFFSYGAACYISRAISNTAFNAVAGPAVSGNSTTLVKNRDHYDSQAATISNSGNNYYVAKYPGLAGSSLKISVCDSTNAYSQVLTGNAFTLSVSVGSNVATLVATSTNATAANTVANTFLGAISVGDILQFGNTQIGLQSLKVSAVGNTSVVNSTAMTANISLTSIYTLAANVSMTQVTRFWEYADQVDGAPTTSTYVEGKGGVGDELHVAVVDEDGVFSGTRGTVLELYPNISRATDAESPQGGTLYYKNKINNESKYIWWAADRAGSPSNTAVNMAAIDTKPLSLSFIGGTDGLDETNIPVMNLAKAYDQYKSAEDVDVSLIMTGKARGGVNGEQLANYIIDNIVEYRKDCMSFTSPELADVLNTLNPEELVVQYRNSLRSTSYAVLDSGYKYQYDRYNDVYRWIPLNGDIAGLVARTEQERDAWWSPGGFNRGQIKNIVKLAFNPDKARRDILYKNNVNPVVRFPGEGTILYGDKTLLTKPSAFDRINVRRLFIVLEKSISTAAKYLLFEFNDEFTRASFRNMVEPYLRDIQGRRGIYDFKVKCDSDNNTPEVIDRNEFVGDIYIKPARSINFITLNFVAVRTGVEFNEVIGKFG